MVDTNLLVGVIPINQVTGGSFTRHVKAHAKRKLLIMPFAKKA